MRDAKGLWPSASTVREARFTLYLRTGDSISASTDAPYDCKKVARPPVVNTAQQNHLARRRTQLHCQQRTSVRLPPKDFDRLWTLVTFMNVSRCTTTDQSSQRGKSRTANGLITGPSRTREPRARNYPALDGPAPATTVLQNNLRPDGEPGKKRAFDQKTEIRPSAVHVCIDYDLG